MVFDIRIVFNSLDMMNDSIREVGERLAKIPGSAMARAEKDFNNNPSVDRSLARLGPFKRRFGKPFRFRALVEVAR